MLYVMLLPDSDSGIGGGAESGTGLALTEDNLAMFGRSLLTTMSSLR